MYSDAEASFAGEGVELRNCGIEAKFAGEGVELRLVTQGNMLPSESMYSRYFIFGKQKNLRKKLTGKSGQHAPVRVYVQQVEVVW